MELLIIRHGATAGNLAGQYIGVTDEPLAPEGVEMVTQLGRVLPPVDGVWTSPLCRCTQTAALLFPGKCPHIAPDLMECNFGAFEGKTWAELSKEKCYRDWAANAGKDFTYPGGESYFHFLRRCRLEVRRCVEEAVACSCARCAIVAHGGTIMAALSAYVPGGDEFYRWRVKPGGGYWISVQLDSFTFQVIKKL